MKEKSNHWLAWALIVVFALTRLPGVLPVNFSAAYALLFCAGVYLPGRTAWWFPLVVMLATDLVLNLFIYSTAPVSAYMIVNYLAYAAIIRLGQWFTARSSWIQLLGGGILGALIFYLITNTAAWVQNPDYTKTLSGWFQALTTGIPGFPPTWEFFRNTLLSGGLFTGLFVGAMKLGEAPEPKEEAAEKPAEPAGEETAVEETKA